MVKFKGTKPKKSLMTELLFEGVFFFYYQALYE